MATIEKLNSIAASKAAIKAAIQEKGVSCDDTLAEYANRIKAIPSPKIEDFQEVTLTTNNQHLIAPSDGYDAIKEVEVTVDVTPTSNVEIVGVDLAQGITFSFPVTKISGVVACYIDGLYSEGEYSSYKFRGILNDADVSQNRYFVINGDVASSQTPSLWLAKWKKTGETVIVTILQEITI